MRSQLQRVRSAVARRAQPVAAIGLSAAAVLAVAWAVSGLDLVGALALVALICVVAMAWVQAGIARDAGDEIRDQVRQLTEERGTLLLAVFDDQVRATGERTGGLPHQYAAELVPALIARGQYIRAFRLAEAACVLDQLPPARLRVLGDRLRHRGYFGPAVAVLGALQEVDHTAEDARRLEAARDQLRQLSGQIEARIDPLPEPVVPVPGRVLHVVGSSMPDAQTGYTVRTRYIVASQRALGLDPRVVTAPGFPTALAAPRTDVVDGVVHHRLAGPKRNDAGGDVWMRAYVDGLLEVVLEFRPAVLHAASDFFNAMAATTVARAVGLPVVYEARGFWEETWLSRHAQLTHRRVEDILAEGDLPDAYTARRASEDEARRRVDRVVTLAPVMAEQIVARGVPAERVRVIPNAVDPELFPVPDRDPGLAASVGIPEGAVVVGYVSSLSEYEGIDDLVRAFARLRATATVPVALLVVGDGAERARLEALAADLDLGGSAIFTGKVPHDDVLRYYGLIDVFVVPRKPVPVCELVTPLKPYEAFATARTLVMSDVAALAGIAAESGAAETFRAGDPDSLAEVLAGLVEHPDRRRELAEAGRAWVLDQRTWDRNARAYAELYAELGAVAADGGAPSHVAGTS